MLKFTLINPPCLSVMENHWADFSHLGIGYIASSLLSAGHEVSVVDAKLAHLSVDETIAKVVADLPNFIGFTTTTAEFPLVSTLAFELKRTLNVPIIVGGSHCNAVGANTLRECEAIDFCCVGEGERLITEVANCFEFNRDWNEIKGLIYRKNDEIIVNPQRPYIDDLDSLSFPAWHLFDNVKQLSILTHRGCPFHCIFCSHNSGTIPRYRSVQNTLDELEYITSRYAPTTIRFEDETFGLHLRRTKDILHGMISRGLHLRAHYHAQTRVDCLDDEFMGLYKAANFEMLELGVESGSDVVLKNILKGITLAQVEKAVNLARQHKVKIWCKFILGHPYETIENLGETVCFISKLNPDRLSVSIMTPYPGTPIYEMAKRGEGGYRLLSESWQSFDKYSGSALELKHISLIHLKWIQIWCFLRLYLINFRMIELLKFTLKNHVMAYQMVYRLLKQIASEPWDRIK